MTATAPATDKRGSGGRPRDPGMAARIHGAVIQLLAERGLGGFTVDDIAAGCSVGKASIYRRWPTMADILCDVVRGLGVREDDVVWPEPGSVRGDLITLLTAAVRGERPAAELAVLSSLPYREDLRQAYTDGPLTRLAAALDTFHLRLANRGEKFADAPRPTQVQAAIAWLATTTLHTGAQPDKGTVADAVDVLLLPSPAERWADDDRTRRRAALVASRLRPGDSIRRTADEHGLPYELLRQAVAQLRPAAFPRDDDYTPEAIDRAQEQTGPPYPRIAATEAEWAAHLDTFTPREPGR